MKENHTLVFRGLRQNTDTTLMAYCLAKLVLEDLTLPSYTKKTTELLKGRIPVAGPNSVRTFLVHSLLAEDSETILYICSMRETSLSLLHPCFSPAGHFVLLFPRTYVYVLIPTTWCLLCYQPLCSLSSLQEAVLRRKCNGKIYYNPIETESQTPILASQLEPFPAWLKLDWFISFPNI